MIFFSWFAFETVRFSQFRLDNGAQISRIESVLMKFHQNWREKAAGFLLSRQPLNETNIIGRFPS